MKVKNFARLVCVAGITALCALGISACSSNGLTGGVAATVNGIEIPEDKVTTYIQQFRESYELTDKSAWKDWLTQGGYTAEEIRDNIIDMYVQQEAIKLAAAEKGITVSAETLDQHVNQIKSNYKTDEEWQKALEKVGMTEAEYRESIELSLLQKDLQAIVAPEEEPSDAELLESCNSYSSFLKGAKRSSHILFSSSDTTNAQSVLDQINAGTLDFATAAQTYSLDGSGASGGDVGWDKINNFVSEYSTALSSLEKGQVSGLVTSTYGIHIIKCTDVFDAPETITSLSQVPEDLLKYVKETSASQKQSTTFSTFLKDYVAGLDVVKNEIPKNVPYYVAITPQADEATETTESGESSEATAEKASTESTSETEESK